MIRSRLPDAPHRALEHRGDAEPRAQIAHVLAQPLEREHRGARGDVEPLDLGERVDQLVGDAVAEVLVLGIGARVDERQHRDGAGLARGAGRRGGNDLGHRRHQRVGELGHRRRSGPPGSLASARASARSIAAGTLGRRVPTGAGASIACRAMVGAGAGARERRLARQHLVEHAGEAVLVAAAVEPGLGGGLLRAHVRRRADREAAVGDVDAVAAGGGDARWRPRSRRRPARPPAAGCSRA